MTKYLIVTALSALAVASPIAAQAQKLNPAVIAVVDNDRVFRECTACKAAQAQMQTQLQQIQQRAQQLGQPLQTEAQSLEAAVKALAGKQPDAALQQRATAFQQKQTAAQKELSDREQAFQRNRAYVAQQIQEKLNPIVSQVMTARGATVALDRQATLAAAASIDVTNDVLAQLNQQLPSVNTTAPAPAAQPAQPQPQGR
ncbi:OmpH family outer membrane protein [Sphingomonas sp. LaA6.9]|uniref:OmpH family outer membrane protein n=1 Tax=Sphingomonas sp. LaA6.9 TaxID=2919914 RepID=UPI001F4FA2A7|nr:OmpH family outer membrane protein [Sphingomonas sp. LaA6.9]MCJ8158566.1 OmpH family outer membrane protein [Sphingomonas sp. LaA6.9]